MDNNFLHLIVLWYHFFKGVSTHFGWVFLADFAIILLDFYFSTLYHLFRLCLEFAGYDEKR